MSILPSHKLTIDMIANLVSLAVLFIAGILINVVIGRQYGPDALGLFNIIFAIFILFSQFGSFGLQYSTLSFTAVRAGQPTEQLHVLREALRIGLVTSSCTVALALLVTPGLAWIFELDDLPAAWLMALPGLWCFALNKVLLAYFNGLGEMRLFALFQSGRYVAMLIAVAILTALVTDGKYLSAILSVAEVVLFFAMAPIAVARLRALPRDNSASWRKRHIRFGVLALPSGAVAELNTRVDVLLLGTMLGVVQTGYYSIAILLAEGYGQAIVVLRNVINPLLAKIALERDQTGLSHLVRTFGSIAFVLMAAGGIALIALFPLLNSYVLAGQFSAAQIPLAILVTGIGLTGPWMIFSMILSQGGRPGSYTMLMISILAANITFNIVGIYTLGLIGAAIGTSLSYVVGALILTILVRRNFGLRLWQR